MKTVDLSHAIWKKSSRSNGQANCVEVATNLPGLVALRDSKDPEGQVLVVSTEEWDDFIGGIRVPRPPMKSPQSSRLLAYLIGIPVE